MRGKWKKWRDARLLNLSLNQKLVHLSIIYIICPLLLMGMGLIIYLYHFNSQTLYHSNYQSMERIIDNLEGYFSEITDLRWECVFDYSLQRIGKDKGNLEDTLNVKKMFDEFVEEDSIYENVSFARETEILIQSGIYLVNIPETFWKEVKNKFVENQSYRCWIANSQLGYSPYTDYSYKGNILTYCAKIDKSFSMKEEDVIGTLYIHINENELYEIYGESLPDESQVNYLISGDGIVLSAKDKMLIGTLWENSKDLQLENENIEYGRFVKNGKIYLYSYVDILEGYLVKEFPYSVYFKNVILVCMIVFLAIALCSIFIQIFSNLQKKYILNPVFGLIENFSKMEKGQLEVVEVEERSDEIGILQSSYNTMILRLQKLIEEVYTANLQKKEAEIQALTAQINPHFLYNTLDSIHWKAILNKDREVAQQIMALSDVYRYVLSRGKEFLTLQEEVTFQKRYMYLMSMRYGEKLRWSCFLDDDLQQYMFPKLIIQPVLENAIIHGIEPQIESGEIKIDIRRIDDHIRILISDTGNGFDESVHLLNDEIEELTESFAIKNINKRLKFYYQNNYVYEISSVKGEGCTVKICIPYREGEE